VFADWLCVLEGIKISNLGVGVFAKKSVCLEVFKVIYSLGCCVSDQVVIA